MRTDFTLEQLTNAAVSESERALRACVHCGFCLSSCPTYSLLGDELDSPRGRIYLIKDMLESDKPASDTVVKHVDRCLSCLACQTICPSDVNYMHLVDHARDHIERTYKRAFTDRFLRGLLGTLMPRPGLFRLALKAASLARPFRALIRGRLRGMIDFAPRGELLAPEKCNRVIPAEGVTRARVGLVAGCVQQVIGPQINTATIRLLTRLGCDVVLLADEACCGSLTHHLGQEPATHKRMKAAITSWSGEIEGDGLDAIVTNISGCGTTLKDYGYLFREDSELAERAERISALAKDVSEFVESLGGVSGTGKLRVAYHAACSLQHGQGILEGPASLLRGAGYDVAMPAEGHLCCGSAGTYNLLQPEIATKLRDRKVRNIESTKPEIIATGNIGCITQIAAGTGIPVVHTVELLDWATGGPKPANLGAIE